MNFFVYIPLGILDIFALFALMFRTFRLPYFEYMREIGIVAAVVSVVSFVVRNYFDANGLLDIVLHFILYIIFFRYLIKIRVKWAIIISFVYFGYGLISAFAYFVFSNIGTSESFITYGTQITQICIAFVISWLFYKLGVGFSFIVRPPHDVFVKKKITKNEMMIINAVILIAAISFFMALLILNHKNFIIIPLNLVLFGILIYMAYRKDIARGFYRTSSSQSSNKIETMEPRD